MYSREQASRAYITGESMEEDDMVKSRVGNTPSTETNRWGRKGCKPKGSYKEVPRPSRGLALAAAKRSLTVYFKSISYKTNILYFIKRDLLKVILIIIR